MGDMGGAAVSARLSPLWSRVQAPAWAGSNVSLFDVLFSPVPLGFFSGFSGFPPSVKKSTVYRIYNVVVVCVSEKCPQLVRER